MNLMYNDYMGRKAKYKGLERRPLTAKQEVFVKKYTDGSNKVTFLNQTQSALASGASLASAHVTGHDMAHKPHVKAAIIEALHKQKITPEFQARKLKELMDATRPIYHEGLKVDTVEDNEIRHKALVTSLKITDAIDNLESQMANKGISIQIAPEMVSRLIAIAQEMKEMRQAHSNQAIPLIEIKRND